jgi:pyruvate,water dikinase
MAERWIVDSDPSARYPIFTRGNVGEVFPDPVTPMAGTIIQLFAEPGWRDAFVRFGAFDVEEFDPGNPEVIGIFGGYCFLNVSISRILGVRTPGLTPESIDQQLWGEQPGVPAYAPQPTDESDDHGNRIFETLIWAMTVEELAELAEEEAMLDELRRNRPDFTAMSDEEIVAFTRQLYDDHFRRLFATHIFTTYCATVPFGIIQQVCAAVGRPEDALKLMAGVGDVASAAPSYAMWELSRLAPDSDDYIATFEAFIRRFGARGPNEWEMRSPTWETDPRLAEVAIDQMRPALDEESPMNHQAARAVEREKLGAEIAALIEGDPEAHDQFVGALRAAPLFLAGRERSKTNAVRLVHEGRMALTELGNRMVERGIFEAPNDFGMLRLTELEDFVADPESWKAPVHERLARYHQLIELEPPFVFDGAPPDVDSWNRRDSRPVAVAGPGDVLRGMAGCPGVARGRARVVTDSYDPTALEPGDVLVAPITDPSWTPLFVPAAAVVVDVGAPLSHAIIVSRELGIPCVVSVTDGTRRIPDGAMVEVDGDNGVVTVLEG